jgi:copper chaperone
MTTKTFKLETLTCPGCIMKIEGAVRKMQGVKEAEVLFNASKAKVSFDESITNTEDIWKTIEKVGFDVLSVK